MGGSRSRGVGAHGGLTVHTWMFGIFVIYRKGMRWRKNSKGGSRLQMIKGTKFFSGVSFLTFVKTFAIHESVSLGKLFMIFSIIIFFPLIQWNFWLYLLPHYWSGQMKHWRQCLFPRLAQIICKDWTFGIEKKFYLWFEFLIPKWSKKCHSTNILEV